jgi:hypothetical protein
VTVGEFLRRQAGSAGAWNCSTLPADWCIALGHPDYAAAWRDIVDENACEATATDAGGLLVLWREGIGDALPPATEPYQAGDIAVVAAHGLEAGAVFTGERWAMRMRRGLMMVALDMVAVAGAWRP